MRYKVSLFSEEVTTQHAHAMGGTSIENILCDQHGRTVGNDNCVRFNGRTLQIPQDQYLYHYVRVKVRVRLYQSDELAIFHGHTKLASFGSDGKEAMESDHKAA